MQMGVGQKNRNKIANTLDMIPMEMREEEVIAPSFIGERITIASNPKSGIKEQRVVAVFNFDTARMCAKHNLIAFGGANLSAGAPKYDGDRIGVVFRYFHDRALAPRYDTSTMPSSSGIITSKS